MALPAEKLQYTYADYLAWREDEHIEIVDGEAYMQAAPIRAHQRAVFEFSRQLGNYLEGKSCRAYAAPFAVRLFEQAGDAPENVDTVVEPDISVICDPAKLDDAGCRGAPDLIIEVLSPTTARHDRFTKFNLYQWAGVREYWIADPAAKAVQVFVLENGHYTAKAYAAAGDTLPVHVLENCTIDLSRVFSE